MASPFEVDKLSKRLNNSGYTVHVPTIFSFGGSTKIANQNTRREWMGSLIKSIRLISKCYTKVHLIGFSLGIAGANSFNYVT